MAHATDIVGYTFNADIYCPDCIVRMVRAVNPNADLMAGIRPTAESTLDSYAATLGIDRTDETTYDSGEFPKVVLRDILGEDTYCGRCQEPIGE